VSRLILYLLGLYKRLLSPMFGARHGALRGSLLASWRLLRCNPMSNGGFDYVPVQFTFRRQTSDTSEGNGP
jgi:putative component of membrane protein insertase Oxa1/YidC/SpoIIIJ protein YidD